VLRFGRTATTCPGCGGIKVLAFYDAQRRPACATCTGNKPSYACVKCGREDSPHGRKCAPCVLEERARELLSDPSGRIHPQLQPVFDTLMAGPRPQTTLYWFNRSTGPGILAAMAQGQIEITHAAFEAMPTNKTNNYLRDFLVAVGVLPPFHAELERVRPWLNDILTGLPKDQADVLGRFARWHVLRRLRHKEQAGVATHGAISGARAPSWPPQGSWPGWPPTTPASPRRPRPSSSSTPSSIPAAPKQWWRSLPGPDAPD